MITTLSAIAIFAITLFLLVYIRSKVNSKLEFKNSEILIALVPVALWLVLSGKIQEFTFGDFKIVTAIQQASGSPVETLVTDIGELPIDRLATGAKSGVSEIPRLIEDKTQALIFQLGNGGYWGPAIHDYLDALVQYPFFRYIIITDSNGNFFGLADARKLSAIAQSPNGEAYMSNLADWLNESREQYLYRLPGFIPADAAIHIKTGRLSALQNMNALNTEELPVVNDESGFVGIIERSKLSASILIDVSEKLAIEKQ